MDCTFSSWPKPNIQLNTRRVDMILGLSSEAPASISGGSTYRWSRCVRSSTAGLDSPSMNSRLRVVERDVRAVEMKLDVAIELLR